MLVNLTDVFTTENKTEVLQLPFERQTVTAGGQAYPILEKSPVTLTLSNTGREKAAVKAKLSLTVLLRCDRCLREVKVPMQLCAEEEFVSPESGVKEEENPLLDGYQLDVQQLVCDEISLNWPMKVLCREDCRGICKICGKDLNEGPCGCDPFVPDPRMAAIKDIFNGNKEV